MSTPQQNQQTVEALAARIEAGIAGLSTRSAVDARAALRDLVAQATGTEAVIRAARTVADMHESGEGFQWVGSEDDTEALDALCVALARLDGAR